MTDFRAWLPTAGAAIFSILCLVLGIRTSSPDPNLPPLPQTVHIRSGTIADFGAELAAPLFAPSRSIQPTGATPDAPPMPPPLLTGVVLGGGKAVALVQRASGGETMMLHTGETLDGWTVVSIAARQMVVARDGTRQTIMLEFGAPKAGRSGDSAASSTAVQNTAASSSFDGLTAATRLGLPASNIPLGSPLSPPR